MGKNVDSVHFQHFDQFFLSFSWQITYLKKVYGYTFWGGGGWESVYFVHSFKCWQLWTSPCNFVVCNNKIYFVVLEKQSVTCVVHVSHTWISCCIYSWFIYCTLRQCKLYCEDNEYVPFIWQMEQKKRSKRGTWQEIRYGSQSLKTGDSDGSDWPYRGFW